MPTETIVNAEDPRIAEFCDLRAERDRSRDPFFICEGAICIRRALENRAFQVQKLLVTVSQLVALEALIDKSTQVYVADNATIMQITGFKFHRGCLATVARPSLRDALDFSTCGTRSRVVFAEAISNPSNMGALIRNARSFGVDRLVFDASSADPFSRRAVRTAMGNVFSQPIARVENLGAAIDAYRIATGAEVWAATLSENSHSLASLVAPPHVGIVLGTENSGLLPDTVARCDRQVMIPMAEGADSLNVAAASAVFLYAVR